MIHHRRLDSDTLFGYLRVMGPHTHPWEMLYLYSYESGIPYPGRLLVWLGIPPQIVCQAKRATILPGHGILFGAGVYACETPVADIAYMLARDDWKGFVGNSIGSGCIGFVGDGVRDLRFLWEGSKVITNFVSLRQQHSV